MSKQKNKATPDRSNDDTIKSNSTKSKYLSSYSQPCEPIDGFNSLAELKQLNNRISKDIKSDMV